MVSNFWSWLVFHCYSPVFEGTWLLFLFSVRGGGIHHSRRVVASNLIRKVKGLQPSSVQSTQNEGSVCVGGNVA